MTFTGEKQIVGPAEQTMVQMATVILVLHICCYVWLRLMEEMGVFPVTLLWQR